MCGRYTLTKKPDPTKLIMPEGRPIENVPRYNVAPSQYCPVVLQSDPKHIHFYRWGLVPHWAKNISIGYKMINARAETILEKNSFKSPVRKRRCLVLADGFYEWKQTEEGKQPYRILLKSREIFSFAGITSNWTSPEGELIESFSIITTDANQLVQPIHDRMPVILTKDHAAQWLQSELSDERILSLLDPFDENLMEAYPVSPLVGSPKNDFPKLIEQYQPPGNLFSNS